MLGLAPHFFKPINLQELENIVDTWRKKATDSDMIHELAQVCLLCVFIFKHH